LNVLLEQLLTDILQNKKQDVKSQVGLHLYQQQFDVLYPSRGRRPRLKELDDILVSFIAEHVLDMPLRNKCNTKAEYIEIISEHIKRQGLNEHLAGKKSVLLNKRKYIYQDQWNLLYPITGRVRVENLDLTLLTFIIMNTFDFKPTSGKWNNMPSQQHTTVADDIVRLRIYRNNICHGSIYGVSMLEFNNYWSDISDALVRLQGPSCRVEIETLKGAPLDPDLEKRYEVMIESWYKQDTEIKDKLQNVTDEVRENKQHLPACIDRTENIQEGKHRNNKKTNFRKYYFSLNINEMASCIANLKMAHFYFVCYFNQGYCTYMCVYLI